MTLVRNLVKTLLKLLIWLIQIPLTVIYFILSFFGGVISGIGWLFGVLVFGATICFWLFGEFDSWIQIVTVLGISMAIMLLPGWLTDIIGEGILFLKKTLADLDV